MPHGPELLSESGIMWNGGHSGRPALSMLSSEVRVGVQVCVATPEDTFWAFPDDSSSRSPSDDAFSRSASLSGMCFLTFDDM